MTEYMDMSDPAVQQMLDDDKAEALARIRAEKVKSPCCDADITWASGLIPGMGWHRVCSECEDILNEISTESEESIAMPTQMFPVGSDSDQEWFWIELAEVNPDAVTFDGFCDCVIGYASQFNKPPVVVYDYEMMLEQLMREDGMDYSDAYEYLSFNVEGLWAGEFTPMIMRKR